MNNSEQIFVRYLVSESAPFLPQAPLSPPPSADDRIVSRSSPIGVAFEEHSQTAATGGQVGSGSSAGMEKKLVSSQLSSVGDVAGSGGGGNSNSQQAASAPLTQLYGDLNLTPDASPQFTGLQPVDVSMASASQTSTSQPPAPQEYSQGGVSQQAAFEVGFARFTRLADVKKRAFISAFFCCLARSRLHAFLTSLSSARDFFWLHATAAASAVVVAPAHKSLV